jgi:Fe-Mn family superoxide dismutase
MTTLKRLGILGVIGLSAILLGGGKGEKMIVSVETKIGTYTVKNFSHLLGLEGIGETTLKNHFKLYEGYVNNTNQLIEKLQSMTPEGKPSLEYAELKRRFGFEFSGMRLHEYYFGNLIKGGKALAKDCPLGRKIDEQYGSLENWQKHFLATGLMRGIGWAILYYDANNDDLLNIWVDEHQVNNLPGCTPVLVMDVWEHAYMTDYQLDRAGYIDAFMKNLNWEEVSWRFNAAKLMNK